MSSLGLGNTIFEITLCTWVFKYLVPKVVFFFPVPSGVLKFINFFENFKFSNLPQVGDLFFWSKSSFSAGGGGHKNNNKSLDVNPYLHCHSGVQRLSIYTTRREAPSLMGSDRIGWDGNQKCPLIFFILCTQIDKVYIYLYTK